MVNITRMLTVLGIIVYCSKLRSFYGLLSCVHSVMQTKKWPFFILQNNGLNLFVICSTILCSLRFQLSTKITMHVVPWKHF